MKFLVDILGIGAAFTGDVTVADEAYGVSWNGSLEVPTKNAVYDKIEAIDPTGDYLLLSGGTMTGAINMDGSSNTSAALQNVRELGFWSNTVGANVVNMVSVSPDIGDWAIQGSAGGDFYYDNSADKFGSNRDFLVPDEVYGVGWNGSLEVPTKNAVYDKIETVEGSIPDNTDFVDLTTTQTITGQKTFNATTTFDFIVNMQSAFPQVQVIDIYTSTPPTTTTGAYIRFGSDAANSLFFNKHSSTIQAFINFNGITVDRTYTLPDATGTFALTSDIPTGGTDYVSKTAGGTFDADISVPDEAYGGLWNASLEVPTKNAVYDEMELKMPRTGGIFTGDIQVPDEAYGVAWNGSVEVPTKNAVYDEIEIVRAAFMTLDTAQSVTALKTFTVSQTFENGIRLGTASPDTSVITMFPATKAGFASGGAFGYLGSTQYFFAKDTEGRGAILDFSNITAGATDRTYTFPNASGTVALTSDITSGVTEVTVGTGLDVANGTTTPNITVDLNELGAGGTLLATDSLVAVNGTASQKQLISAIPLSIFNNDAGWTSNTGDITNVIAGSGLTGGGASGDVTLNVGAGALIDVSGDTVNVDLSEAALLSVDMVGADEFIVLDNSTASAQRRKAASAINLSIFNNDAGFTTNVGDITGVTAGTGLTGGGTANTVTLNVGAGDGISVAADTVAVDSTVVRTTGTQTIGGAKTFSSDVSVPDEVYGAGWNGSLEVPTKNAVYDKIETIGGGATDHGALTGLGDDDHTIYLLADGTRDCTGDFTIRGNLDTADGAVRSVVFENTAITDADERMAIFRARNDAGGTGARGGYFQFITRRPDSTSFDFPMDVFGDLLDISVNTNIDGDLIVDNGFIEVLAGEIKLGVAGTTSGSVSLDKADGGANVLAWENDFSRWRLGGSGTKAGWRWDNFDTTAFTVTSGGEVTARLDMNAVDFNLSSDERLKKNIKPLGDYKISTNWVQYDWKESGKHDIGLIAQELEKTNPEFVKTDAEGMKSVSYTKVLVAKMAEKDKQIKQLEARLERLELILSERL